MRTRTRYGRTSLRGLLKIMDNYATQYIGKEVNVVIDRPLHSRHPKHGFEYKLNYGYVPNTTAPDGEEVDAYVLGIDEPVESFVGICIAVIHRTNDSDDKLIVIPSTHKNITDEEIKNSTHFQEQFFESEIIR